MFETGAMACSEIRSVPCERLRVFRSCRATALTKLSATRGEPPGETASDSDPDACCGRCFSAFFPARVAAGQPGVPRAMRPGLPRQPLRPASWRPSLHLFCVYLLFFGRVLPCSFLGRRPSALPLLLGGATSQSFRNVHKQKIRGAPSEDPRESRRCAAHHPRLFAGGLEQTGCGEHQRSYRPNEPAKTMHRNRCCE